MIALEGDDHILVRIEAREIWLSLIVYIAKIFHVKMWIISGFPFHNWVLIEIGNRVRENWIEVRIITNRAIITSLKDYGPVFVVFLSKVIEIPFWRLLIDRNVVTVVAGILMSIVIKICTCTMLSHGGSEVVECWLRLKITDKIKVIDTINKSTESKWVSLLNLAFIHLIQMVVGIRVFIGVKHDPCVTCKWSIIITQTALCLNKICGSSNSILGKINSCLNICI